MIKKLVPKIKVLIRDNKILSKIYFFISFFFKFNKFIIIPNII